MRVSKIVKGEGGAESRSACLKGPEGIEESMNNFKESSGPSRNEADVGLLAELAFLVGEVVASVGSRACSAEHVVCPRNS